MKITLESTIAVRTIRLPCGCECKMREWTGATAGGVPVVVLVPAIAVDAEHAPAFDRELAETGGTVVAQTVSPTPAIMSLVRLPGSSTIH